MYASIVNEQLKAFSKISNARSSGTTKRWHFGFRYLLLSHWSGDELVRRFYLYGLVCLNTVRYGWVRWDTVRFAWVRLDEVVASSVFVMVQPEQHPVRETWRWVPAPAEGQPWGNPSVDAQCGWTRTTGVVESHPEMSAWGSARGTWRWAFTHVENRPWGNPSIHARCGRIRRTSVGELLASYIGHHLASPGATPSQGNLTLGVSSHRESTTGEPIDRCSVRLHQMCRGRGRRYPFYGGTHQERHLHAVCLERRSGVTRIVAPAELPCLCVLSLLIYLSV